MIDSVPSNKGASTFCSAVNCIDGRVQLPVIQYLTRWFHVDFVDIVSDTGPVGVLAHNPDTDRAASIYRQINVSRNAHKSHGLAIVATTIVPEIGNLWKANSTTSTQAPRISGCGIPVFSPGFVGGKRLDGYSRSGREVTGIGSARMPSVAGRALDLRVTVEDTTTNLFQPTLRFRGFTA